MCPQRSTGANPRKEETSGTQSSGSWLSPKAELETQPLRSSELRACRSLGIGHSWLSAHHLGAPGPLLPMPGYGSQGLFL